ncbi:MAG TPA: hypothetical protein VF228_15190 [Iamia sp.]
MDIPVFVSAPSSENLTRSQRARYQTVVDILGEMSLEPRALGRSDFPSELPLREVFQIARRCSGGVILGFVQDVGEVVVRPGLTRTDPPPVSRSYPTPWNQLEAGILFAAGVPLLILKETAVSGGVFDHGVTDVFVHDMPAKQFTASQRKQLAGAMMKWHGKVQGHYYDWQPTPTR